MSLPELCDHLEQVHHPDLIRQLEELRRHAERWEPPVAGEACALELRESLETFVARMRAHLRAEKRLYGKLRAFTVSDFAQAGSIRADLQRMQEEHASVEESLAMIMERADACADAGWGADREGWSQLQSALHATCHRLNDQIFEENQILYRRTAAIR